MLFIVIIIVAIIVAMVVHSNGKKRAIENEKEQQALEQARQNSIRDQIKGSKKFREFTNFLNSTPPDRITEIGESWYTTENGPDWFTGIYVITCDRAITYHANTSKGTWAFDAPLTFTRNQFLTVATDERKWTNEERKYLVDLVNSYVSQKFSSYLTKGSNYADYHTNLRNSQCGDDTILWHYKFPDAKPAQKRPY